MNVSGDDGVAPCHSGIGGEDSEVRAGDSEDSATIIVIGGPGTLSGASRTFDSVRACGLLLFFAEIIGFSCRHFHHSAGNRHIEGMAAACNYEIVCIDTRAVCVLVGEGLCYMYMWRYMRAYLLSGL